MGTMRRLMTMEYSDQSQLRKMGLRIVDGPLKKQDDIMMGDSIPDRDRRGTIYS